MSPTIIMYHSLLCRHIVLLTVGVYSSNHRVLYTIGVSMTRRFHKSVCPSVCLFVCNANKKAYSIIDSRKIIRISGERAYNPLQENEEIFSKKYFSKIWSKFFFLILLHFLVENFKPFHLICKLLFYCL